MTDQENTAGGEAGEEAGGEEYIQRIGDYVHLTRRDGVAVVTFDRGDGLNALSVAAMGELTEAARQLRDDLTVSAIVLTGAGGIFSAGADLKDPALQERASLGLLERRQLLRVGPDLCQAWEALEQVTIVAVEGFCIGGGVALAVACDIRVAAEDASFRLPEIPLGMNMSWQSNPRLVALMGPARAKLFTILGESLEAAAAREWGLVEIVAGKGAALAQACDVARRVAALPPVAVRMTKQAITMAALALGPAVSYMDRDQFALASTTRDQQEAVRSFLEKRAPRFTGK